MSVKEKKEVVRSLWDEGCVRVEGVKEGVRSWIDGDEGVDD